jgi:hypothetical protein
MSPHKPTAQRVLAPIFGILAPGEKRTRTFPPLPVGTMPLLQNFPGGSVRLVEQTSASMTIENTGTAHGPFSILFVTQSQLQKLMILKQTLDGVAQLRKKP